MAISDKNKKKLLQQSLVANYSLKVETPKPESLTVEEVFDDKLIFNIDGQLYEASYEIGADGKAAVGEAKKVTSTVIFTTEALSMNSKRDALDAALHTHLSLNKDEWVYVEDITDSDVIYNRNQQSYKVPFTLTEDGVATFGDSTKVVRQVTYKAMESLRTVYGEIIQEAGKRNALKDSGRIKTILALCNELLENEDPEEDAAKEALKKAKAELKWAKEQPAVQVIEGVEYTNAAFAYTPDMDKPEDWQLLLYEGETVSAAKLKEASAALSPGGFAGHKATIPDTHLEAVKRRIRTEYRGLGVDDDDIPRWVKETESREHLNSFVSLAEAKFDKGRATVTVIVPGFNVSEDRYYPKEMLKRDYKVFEGVKMYADHPTDEEDKARPERSIKDWVATLKDVTVDESGVVSGIAEITEPWLMTKLATLRDKAMLGEMGVSINAIGSASKGKIDGKDTLVIEKLVGARSVDFVTEPGAGGIVTMYESDRGRDVDLIELSGLKEKRPDLIKAIEAEVKSVLTQEVKKAMDLEKENADLKTANETLTKENTDMKEAQEKADKDKAIAEAQATIKEAVEKAELHPAAKEALLERFKDAETADGITEAITAEKDYILKLGETGKVKDLGDPPKKDEAEEADKKLRASFKESNPTWTEAELDNAVKGR